MWQHSHSLILVYASPCCNNNRRFGAHEKTAESVHTSQLPSKLTIGTISKSWNSSSRPLEKPCKIYKHLHANKEDCSAFVDMSKLGGACTFICNMFSSIVSMGKSVNCFILCYAALLSMLSNVTPKAWSCVNEDVSSSESKPCLGSLSYLFIKASLLPKAKPEHMEGGLACLGYPDIHIPAMIDDLAEAVGSFCQDCNAG